MGNERSVQQTHQGTAFLLRGAEVAASRRRASNKTNWESERRSAKTVFAQPPGTKLRNNLYRLVQSGCSRTGPPGIDDVVYSEVSDPDCVLSVAAFSVTDSAVTVGTVKPNVCGVGLRSRVRSFAIHVNTNFLRLSLCPKRVRRRKSRREVLPVVELIPLKGIMSTRHGLS
jgi:hypothetical protein